jgi:hypothetical protein
MSGPISASNASAVRRCTPGIVQSSSTAAAKGRSCASISPFRHKPPRLQVARHRAHRSSARRDPYRQRLPRRPIPATPAATRPPTRPRRRRTLDPLRLLAHAANRRALPRTRRRPLPPPRSRTHHPPLHRPTRTARTPRHTRGPQLLDRARHFPSASRKPTTTQPTAASGSGERRASSTRSSNPYAPPSERRRAPECGGPVRRVLRDLCHDEFEQCASAIGLLDGAEALEDG